MVNSVEIPEFKPFEYVDENITKVEEDILERRKKELNQEKESKTKFINEMRAIEILKFLNQDQVGLDIGPNIRKELIYIQSQAQNDVSPEELNKLLIQTA